jgi:hypothetical protein
MAVSVSIWILLVLIVSVVDPVAIRVGTTKIAPSGSFEEIACSIAI